MSEGVHELKGEPTHEEAKNRNHRRGSQTGPKVASCLPEREVDLETQTTMNSGLAPSDLMMKRN